MIYFIVFKNKAFIESTGGKEFSFHLDWNKIYETH